MEQGNRRKKEKSTIAAKHLLLMQTGSFLTKIRGKGKTYRRFFQLDSELLSFGYSDSKKLDCSGQGAMINSSDHRQVLVSEIQDIRAGHVSDVFTKSKSSLNIPSELCFSIVIGAKHKTLDLAAETREERNAWVGGLKHLVKKRSEADLETQQDIWMRELFQYADRNNDKELSLKEIIRLLKNLNFEVEQDQAKNIFKELFQKADTDKSVNERGEDFLNIQEFIDFYQLLTERKEINELFSKYNYDGTYLDARELQDFLSKEQMLHKTESECQALIREHEPCPKVKAQDKLSIDGFNSLIASSVLDVFNPQHRGVYQDMTRPLRDYFIDSSHNTYLTADQLVGHSSVECYIRALKRGCRCVELDIWDGSDGEPVIYHGYTLTSKIPFKDVIWAAGQYSFEASPYPVILSFENHCSVEQQKRMAHYLKSILGEKLYVVDPQSPEKLSPEDLKGYIIVKGKKLPPIHNGEEDEDEDEVSDEDEAEEMEDEQVKKQLSKKKGKKLKLAREMSDLIAICRSVHFHGFDYAKSHYLPTDISSLGEGKCLKLVKQNAAGFVRHNQWQMTRTYPGGARTDSSNYNPCQFWKVGCQIVALNYQTSDDYMQIYKGFFEDNGSCGYVLKPRILIEEIVAFNPDGPYPLEWKKSLKLKIISGYQLPKKKGDGKSSILDPYIKIEIKGVESDMQKQKTNVLHNNGFHPVWDEALLFEVNVPELAIIYFQVMDYESISSNSLVAQYAMPFNSLTPGYRTVHLRSKHGEMLRGASLWVHVSLS